MMPRVILLLASAIQCLSFAPAKLSAKIHRSRLFNTEGSDETPEPKLTLEDKMKAWEASDDEIKAATLGGFVPGRSDAFDVGLYILFPIMIVGLGLFAFFPILVQNIDVTSVGPPPTS